MQHQQKLATNPKRLANLVKIVSAERFSKKIQMSPKQKEPFMLCFDDRPVLYFYRNTQNKDAIFLQIYEEVGNIYTGKKHIEYWLVCFVKIGTMMKLLNKDITLRDAIFLQETVYIIQSDMADWYILPDYLEGKTVYQVNPNVIAEDALPTHDSYLP